MENEYNYHTSYQEGALGENPNPVNKEPKKKKEKKPIHAGIKWATCISMALVFGILASAAFQAGNIVFNRVLGVQKTVTANSKKVDATAVSTKSDAKVNSDIADIAENVMPSVVSITNLSVKQAQDFFFGNIIERETQSSGSGIIIGQNETELLIVTNNHVVEQSKTLTVSFVDNESVEAQVKGTDADRDLAIVAVPLKNISGATMDAIKTATLGDSKSLRVGEPTIAIGNALGYGQSVTNGIVSALDREIEGFDSKLIQTNAAINPGNSGGALLNSNGEVIGINTVKVNADAVEGMGYAIPISDVSDIINELMNKETRTKVNEFEQGVLGISGLDVQEEAAQMYNMPKGVYISEVSKGSGAAKAKLTKGSIITAIEGTKVENMDGLKEQLSYYKAGETVKLTIQIPEITESIKKVKYK